MEMAVTKTNCMYTASSKVVQETSSSWLAIREFKQIATATSTLLRRPEVKKLRNDAVRMLGNDLSP